MGKKRKVLNNYTRQCITPYYVAKFEKYCEMTQDAMEIFKCEKSVIFLGQSVYFLKKLFVKCRAQNTEHCIIIFLAFYTTEFQK